MNEKKRTLIETGMKLFAQKGFHETSIQEIADKSGVSKGSFYLHFDSKEDLTLNIHQYYYYGLMEEVNKVQQQELPPKESLAAQVKVLLEAFMSNKDFIIMHMRENVNVPSESNDFLMEIRRHSFQWGRSNLLSIYGAPLQDKVVDAVILLEGMLHSYFKWLVLDDIELDLDSLSTFIVRRVDDVVQGMLQEEEQPQIAPEQIQDYFPDESSSNSEEKITGILSNMRQKVDHLQLPDEQKNDLLSALNVIEQELEKEQPQRVVLQGMLTHFKDKAQFENDIEALANHLGIPLLT
ncbi:TetR/AcrR family transcriptional regulator [Pontibacillus yanchengensis]|uniref:HTH tetR-type domain-containing protein n=1 Tax=Pontibacillus yanchengensis Y32 TaxID=1385514 RepID=A0A0A2T7P8_9BACI|nr:TetR/AcrR family transcriptional regulator [Pontibacillus yanchengensis]KGP71817.1 hypothetical protein N782_16375 [Pontibacillus yanchengensis Y32]